MSEKMHYETVWFALSHMLERIRELMAAPRFSNR